MGTLHLRHNQQAHSGDSSELAQQAAAQTPRYLTPDGKLVNALSVDLEDWFHLEGVQELADPALWPGLPTIVEEETYRLLELLDQQKVRATFFVLGWIAERYPGVVRAVAQAGHEIGSHSYWHRRVDRMTPQQFREDLERSVQLLQDLTGQRVLGFRAPAFSITPGAEWAFDVMQDVGIRYDASLFPAQWGHGVYPCPPQVHWTRSVPSGRPMLELPMSMLRIGPLSIPFSGGGYFRVLPWRVIRYGFWQYHRRGQPVVAYLHPRDYATDCPQPRMRLHQRLRCFAGIRGTWEKVVRMVREYPFDTCAAVLGLETPRAVGKALAMKASQGRSD